MKRPIARLHYLTQDLDNHSHVALIQHALLGGIDWIQLRVKGKDYAQWKEIALASQSICKAANATFIINDNVNLAAEIGADGVHLGKNDLSPTEARKILGNNKIIGGTANNWQDIEKLIHAQVDYIGLGPFRFTSTKQNLSPILGIEGYKMLVQTLRHTTHNIPIIAIGGIQLQDIPALMQTGISGIAVSSALHSPTPLAILKDWRAKIDKFAV